MNGDLKRLLFTLTGVAIVSSWGFAATRASNGDVGENTSELKRVERESRQRDQAIGQELREIREGVSELSADQREFRARVLEAIRQGSAQ